MKKLRPENGTPSAQDEKRKIIRWFRVLAWGCFILSVLMLVFGMYLNSLLMVVQVIVLMICLHCMKNLVMKDTQEIECTCFVSGCLWQTDLPHAPYCPCAGNEPPPRPELSGREGGMIGPAKEP